MSRGDVTCPFEVLLQFWIVYLALPDPVSQISSDAGVCCMVQLISDSLRHIVLAVKGSTLLDMSDQASHMVRLHSIMLLVAMVAPTVRSEVTRWTGTSHQGVDSLPHRRLIGSLLIRGDLRGTFRMHGLRGRATTPPVPGLGAITCSLQDVAEIERNVHTKLLSGSE